MTARQSRPAHVQPSSIIIVFLGGIVGTGLRYGLEKAFAPAGTEWPWATFGINLTGAFALGLLLETLTRCVLPERRRAQFRLFFGTGVCGSYTTYSTFAGEVTMLIHRGAIATAIGYAVGSVVLGVICAQAGAVAASVSIRGARPGASS
ncbi:MAG: fluoride efflux transporter CrcB [Gordonia sp. (in: high G+C Gram-positive bacteria)]